MNKGKTIAEKICGATSLETLRWMYVILSGAAEFMISAIYLFYCISKGLFIELYIGVATAIANMPAALFNPFFPIILLFYVCGLIACVVKFLFLLRVSIVFILSLVMKKKFIFGTEIFIILDAILSAYIYKIGINLGNDILYTDATVFLYELTIVFKWILLFSILISVLYMIAYCVNKIKIKK